MPVIGNDEHVFVCGMTGSGKSYFVERFLACYGYVIKLDTKGEVDQKRKKGEPIWNGLTEGTDFTVVRKLIDLPSVETKKAIYAPRESELNEEYYNEFFRYCYERENNIVWVDELMSVSSANSCPEYLKYTSIMGRSRNVSLWCCTQRPVGVPQVLISNCTHFVVYNMRNDVDRKKIQDVTGFPELRKLPNDVGKEPFCFWYANTTMEKPTICRLKEV